MTNGPFRAGEGKIVEEKAYDPYAYAFTVIQEQHRLVHDGFFYHAHRRVATLATATNDDILLSVPAATRPHLQNVLISVSNAPLDAKIYEGTTTSADGTAMTVFNRNRNSTNTPNAVLTHTPTVTDPGTLIHDTLISSPSKDAGLVAEGTNEEWVLKPSTKYLIRFTNNSGGNITIVTEVTWYEINYA